MVPRPQEGSMRDLLEIQVEFGEVSLRLIGLQRGLCAAQSWNAERQAVGFLVDHEMLIHGSRREHIDHKQMEDRIKYLEGEIERLEEKAHELLAEMKSTTTVTA